MRFLFMNKLCLIAAVVVAMLLNTTPALAHESRNISEYRFTVGWIIEPAFEGQKNGVDLRVTDNKTGNPVPVEGLEKTLQVEITHVPSGTSKVFNLRTIFRDPGHYTNDLILTAPGHYRFRFFGTIERVPVNETFESRSGGGGFNDMQSAAELQFPEKLPEVREIVAAVRGTQDIAQQAQDRASSASTLAIAGIALGAIGIVFAAGVTVMALLKRKG